MTRLKKGRKDNYEPLAPPLPCAPAVPTFIMPSPCPSCRPNPPCHPSSSPPRPTRWTGQLIVSANQPPRHYPSTVPLSTIYFVMQEISTLRRFAQSAHSAWLARWRHKFLFSPAIKFPSRFKLPPPSPSRTFLGAQIRRYDIACLIQFPKGLAEVLVDRACAP
jgi:hypothetical protein